MIWLALCFRKFSLHRGGGWARGRVPRGKRALGRELLVSEGVWGLKDAESWRTPRLHMVSASRLVGGDPERKRLERRKLFSLESTVESGTPG